MGVGNGFSLTAKTMNNLLKIREKSKEPIGYMKPNFWQLKGEKLLLTEDLSLKKESENKKNELKDSKN